MAASRQRLLRFSEWNEPTLLFPSSFPPLSPSVVFTRRGQKKKKRGSKCKSWRASFKRIPLLIRLVRIRLSESALLCTRRRRALDNVSPRTERTLARIVWAESLPFPREKWRTESRHAFRARISGSFLGSKDEIFECSKVDGKFPSLR